MERYSADGSGDRDGARFQGWGRGRTNTTSEKEQLRRPHGAPPRPVDNTKATLELASKSSLSATAVEFIPKQYWPGTGNPSMLQPSRSGLDNRLAHAREPPNPSRGMNYQQMAYFAQNYPQYQEDPQQHANNPAQCQFVNGPELYPQYNQPSNMQDLGQFDGGSGDYADKHQNSGYVSALRQLSNAMHTLTMNPGKFDSLVSPLVDTLNPHLEQSEQSEEVVNMIIQQSLMEGNLRYSGARLCTHLDTVTSADRSTSVFRSTLTAQCQEMVEQQSQRWQQTKNHTDEDEKYCHGLILFLAELVTQMEPGLASTLGKLLLQLISTVLQNPGPTSAKNVCQALKLSGHTLERDNSGNRTSMERVMRSLSELVIQGKVDTNVKLMVNSVSELRSGNWGRVMPSHPLPIETNCESTSQHISDDPVFYGPDGQILSAEESKFLADSVPQDDSGDGDFEDGDEGLWEEEEDELIAEAYEEFLKLPPTNPGNITNYSANNRRVLR